MDSANAMASVSWLAVAVSTVLSFVLGGLWYGPVMGKAWMRASGVTEEMSKQGNPARIFGLSFVALFLAAFSMAMFIGPDQPVSFGVFAGFMTGAFFVAPAIAVIYLFELRPFAHWAINAGYFVITFTMMGALIGFWQ